MGANKVSISLLNTKTGFTTPWHCTVAQLSNGEWVSAPMSEFKREPRLELVYENDRPSYYREVASKDGSPPISDTSATFLREPKPVRKPYSHSSTPSEVSNISGLSTPDGRSSPATSLQTPEKTGRSSSVNGDIETSSYGRRLIPQIMDTLAATEPGRTVFSIVSFPENQIQFQYISALQFTKAVDKTAWWLHNQVGKPESILPVGYIGPRKSYMKDHPFQERSTDYDR